MARRDGDHPVFQPFGGGEDGDSGLAYEWVGVKPPLWAKIRARLQGHWVRAYKINRREGLPSGAGGLLASEAQAFLQGFESGGEVWELPEEP